MVRVSPVPLCLWLRGGCPLTFLRANAGTLTDNAAWLRRWGSSRARRRRRRPGGSSGGGICHERLFHISLAHARTHTRTATRSRARARQVTQASTLGASAFRTSGVIVHTPAGAARHWKVRKRLVTLTGVPLLTCCRFGDEATARRARSGEPIGAPYAAPEGTWNCATRGETQAGERHLTWRLQDNRRLPPSLACLLLLPWQARLRACCRKMQRQLARRALASGWPWPGLG
jgi:hypothetical protein